MTVQVTLQDEKSEHSARKVKGALERTRLGDVAKSIHVDLNPYCGPCVSIQLDRHLIHCLQLNITAASVRRCILADKKLKLKEHHVRYGFCVTDISDVMDLMC